MKSYRIFLVTFVSMLVAFTSCTKDLDTVPLDPDLINSANVFDDDEAYIEYLAKLYSNLTITGQEGPYGNSDIPTIGGDEGKTSFMRLYFEVTENSTDESLNNWNDPLLNQYSSLSVSDLNDLNVGLYQRVFNAITLCNEYIRIVGTNVEGLSGELKEDVTIYLGEARFLRALFYFYAMEVWGNVPFVTATGAYLPEQIKRPDLFAFIESELKAIDGILLPPNQEPQYYARANQAAAWALLARMYLNAEVYLGAGNGKYAECITYCERIIDAGYELHPVYKDLFLADNDRCRDEIILPIAENGAYTQGYGGMTYIVHAACPANVPALDTLFGFAGGTTSGWGGNRCTGAFTSKFESESGTDPRGLFYTIGQEQYITENPNFAQGYICTKFRNVRSDGEATQNYEFPDTDFPLFRLADVYLMYAEAVLRGGSGGNISTALGYINELRERAYGDDSGNISESELTLDFIIDERARELYWEVTRRADLIRFGLYTSNEYVWEFKGGQPGGIAGNPRSVLWPIPAFDLALNPNLEQNPGY